MAVAPPNVDLTVEGLQWMLLRATGLARDSFSTHGVPCALWLDAYDAAPEAVTKQCVMNNTWKNKSMLAAIDPGPNTWWTWVHWYQRPGAVITPIETFLFAANNMPNDLLPRLFRVLKRCGLFVATHRSVMTDALLLGRRVSPRAFALLIADPNADAALPGPTRCNAGDAHTPPRHHSVRSACEHVTVHDVLYRAVECDETYDPAVWRAFSDARLPFGSRAMDEEWALELAGPCGCAGEKRINDYLNPLHHAIACGNDEAGEWLAARLPPKRLNEFRFDTSTPLIAALHSDDPLPRTVAALLLRVPDVDVMRCVKWRTRSWSIGTMCCTEYGDGKERNSAEWMALQPRSWHPPHLAAELKLKTEQFGAQYPPAAAVLCVEALCGPANVPRELVNLVLQYTALPQPKPWPNTHNELAAAGCAATVASAVATAAASP